MTNRSGTGRGMMRVIALALAAPAIAAAQQNTLIEPTAAHYVLAADQIALQRASESLLRAERVLSAMLVQAEAERLAERRRIARRDALVDAHARRVQAWHGMLPRSILPGNGWHEVHR